MYIKIGNTNIKYRSGVDDFMIFSEIPDSQLSYEKPILVRTKDELDIWFGKDFTDRNYFDELLRKGVTLYLYKPVKENNTNDIDDYIDIDSYYIFPEIFYSLPKTGESGYAYYLTLLTELKHYYTFGLRDIDNTYTWIPVEDSLENYSIEETRYPTIYDLPHSGLDNVAYYVEKIPQSRYWYIYEDGEWKELGYRNLSDYIPYKNTFSDSYSFPPNGIYKYYVLFDEAWYIWKGVWEKVENPETVENMQEFPMYFDKSSNLPEIGDNYRYYANGEWYIWLGESWTPESIFPQNLDNLSWSLNNRDTLLISKPEYENLPYSYPEFRLYQDNHLGVFSREYNLDLSEVTEVDPDNLDSIIKSVELGYKTLAIKLTYTEEELGSGYIIIESQVDTLPPYDIYSKGHKYCFYTDEESTEELTASDFSGMKKPISTITELIESYKTLGYKAEKIGNNEYLIYSENLFDFNEFYTYSDVTLNNDFEDTQNIITKYIGNNKGVEFYSKTIGTAYQSSENNDESLISIQIEEIDYEKYRITTKRYDYKEIYEGPIFTQPGEERLDSIINNNSKLLMCDIVGLKNGISQTTYQGLVENGPLESQDFSLQFKIYQIHNYIPTTGEPGYRYRVVDGLWNIWDESTNEWKQITRISDEYYETTELALDYPDFASLGDNGCSECKYYVESTDKWYTWKGEWVVLEDEVNVGEMYTIKVSRLGYEEYAIYFTVGGISEAYSGNLFELENIIENSESEIIKSFKFIDLCNSLRTGTYYLKGGKNEVQTRDMYIKSLGCIFDTQIDNTFPDFFLVPDIKKYMGNLGPNNSFYSEYKNIFLEHAKNFNCQFLIQNNESEYKPVNLETLGVNSFEDILEPEEDILYYKIPKDESDEFKIYVDGNFENPSKEIQEIALAGGDFIYNYTKDISNYLVYFFKPLTRYGYERPAYYVFLEGLLRNIYSLDETEINYESPLVDEKGIYDPYEIDSENVSELLEKYKSNFLINNNHMFYYKKYFNGSKYDSTVWMRFVIGKIYRELQKNRWSYLAQKSLGVIETGIRNTLERIQNKFSIVQLINLTKIEPKMSKNYLELEIDTYVRDLMNNNMTLDITINYNENNIE